jgi:hypothetical protein
MGVSGKYWQIRGGGNITFDERVGIETDSRLITSARGESVLTSDFINSEIDALLSLSGQHSRQLSEAYVRTKPRKLFLRLALKDHLVLVSGGGGH